MKKHPLDKFVFVEFSDRFRFAVDIQLQANLRTKSFPLGKKCTDFLNLHFTLQMFYILVPLYSML